MAKVEQTKKAKEEFYSPLLPFLKVVRTRQEMCKYTLLSERKIRDEINTIGKHYALIRGSFQKGYRIAKSIDSMSFDEKIEELKLAYRTVNEFASRIQDRKKTQKPLIAYIKVLEKRITKATEEHC